MRHHPLPIPSAIVGILVVLLPATAVTGVEARLFLASGDPTLPLSTTPTRSTTWGQVKALYR